MPTPRPSRLLPPGSASNAAPAPLPSCSRLAWRAVARLGEMPITSVRAASASSAVTGTMADSARTDR